MSWAWFRKPYLHQKPLGPGQFSIILQLWWLPAITCHARKVVLESGCVLRKKGKTHGTPRNGVQHVDVNHARAVVFVTQGDRMPHVATTSWMHRHPIPLFNVHPTKNVLQSCLLKNPFLNCDPKFSTSQN